MTRHLASAPAAITGVIPAARTMSTRYGTVAIEPQRVITFKNGLLGFADRVRFVLADVPGRRVAFKLLQALDDPDLGFLVLPLDPEDGPIARDDLEAACRDLGVAFERLAALAVVTLRAELRGLVCTANLRAPLLIDTGSRFGCQHVLAGDRYPVRHVVDLGPRDGRWAGVADGRRGEGRGDG